MKSKIIKLLQYFIWLIEGKALDYYKKQIDIFLRFTIPNQISMVKRHYGMIRQYSFNVIDIVTTYDSEVFIGRAVEENERERTYRNQKKAHMSVERYAQRWKGQKMDDIEHMESLSSSVKLSREEKAYAALAEVR